MQSATAPARGEDNLGFGCSTFSLRREHSRLEAIMAKTLEEQGPRRLEGVAPRGELERQLQLLIDRPAHGWLL